MEYGQINKATGNTQEMPLEAEESLQRVRARLDRALAEVSEKTKEAAKYTNRRVHDHPWSAVGIGFGLGVLVGVLVTMPMASAPRYRGFLDRIWG